MTSAFGRPIPIGSHVKAGMSNVVEESKSFITAIAISIALRISVI
jgi:hypothetical protein